MSADITDGGAHWQYLGPAADYRLNAYHCITAGTSAGSVGPVNTGADIADGTAHWRYVASASNAMFMVDAYCPTQGFCEVENIVLDAQRVFNHSIRLRQASYSHWHRVKCYLPLIDGCHVDADGVGTDFALFDLCIFELCGQIFRSSGMTASPSETVKVTISGSTVTTTSGSRVITFSGSPGLLSRGIRRGDHVRIGTAPEEWLQIDSVDGDNQITSCVNNPSSYSRGSQEWQIGVGDGYHEVTNNESNVNKHFNCQFRHTAGTGASYNGLYGPQNSGCQFDTIGSYGISIGIQGYASVIITTIERSYFESIGAPASIWLGGASGVTINGINTALPATAFGNASYAVGVLVLGNQLSNGSIIDSSGDSIVSNLWSSNLYRATARSRFVWLSNQGVIVSLGSTITVPDGMNCYIYSGNGTLTAVPSLSDGVADGQIIQFMVSHATDALTLQDESVLSGSKLKLKTPRITLKEYDTLDLQWDTSKWREVGRAVKEVIGDSTSAAGNATLNNSRGRSKLAAAASSITITTDKCSADSVVTITMEDLDATATNCKVAASAGSFIVTFNAAATAATRFNWRIE